MSTHNAATRRRITFQPVDPSRKVRPASVPAKTPVTATRGAGGWQLIADIDGPGDYVVNAIKDDFQLNAEADEVACKPWCSYGGGHTAGDDAYCAGDEMRVNLTQEPTVDLGGSAQRYDSLVVYAEHHHEVAGESGVFLGRGDNAGMHLTDQEALRLSAMLIDAVHQRVLAVIPQ